MSIALTNSSQKLGIPHILEAWAERSRERIAVAAPERSPLTYDCLLIHIKNVVGTLNAMGVGRNERVAIALDNGPEMAVALLAVTLCATAAPMNPDYSELEFDFLMSDLNIKALIVPSGFDSAARTMAQKRGIFVVEISPIVGAEVDLFKLEGEKYLSPSDDVGYPKPNDVAVVLHTSGTTSRPKIVPLTHANIFTSASNMKIALGLSENDRCLNLMPMFHIHGIMATVSSLLGGGSVCSVRFEPETFFKCLNEFAPTWYTAVPTMHQAILRLANARQDVIERAPIKFVRSSSAALPAQVGAELERVFQAPVIEAYGMTEACHQITSNRLPPGRRKSGSVGPASGPEVAIMDRAGNLLPQGETGEIVIQGGNVFHGYENNLEANADSFNNGWFRTGDDGFLDPEGNLFITGRLKDIINRGGEKISPAEIDAVLLSHPAVEEAVAFSVPHSTLGEDIAAAVVLCKDASIAESGIREFLAGRLTAFKMPRRILILDEIPKGSTGKLQRRALTEKFGLLDSKNTRSKSTDSYVPPFETVEHQLAQIWEELLDVRPIGIQDNFFDLGGNSFLAIQMMQRVEHVCGEKAPVAALLAGPTISNLAKALVKQRTQADRSLFVKIQSGEAKLPFFFLRADMNGGGFYCLNLARGLGADQPFYAVSPHGLNGSPVPRRIELMATSYIDMMRLIQPEGPYLLGGYCRGGVIAYEMARQLTRRGQTVDLVVLIAAQAWNSRFRFLHGIVAVIGYLLRFDPDQRSELFQLWRSRLIRHEPVWQYYVARLKHFAELPFKKQIAWVLGKLKGGSSLVELPAHLRLGPRPPVTPRDDIEEIYYAALESYVPRAYSGRVVLFWPSEEKPRSREDPTMGWKKVAPATDVEVVPGDHFTAVTTYVNVLLEHMKRYVESARTK